jgi:hypothetical protein
MSFVVIRNLEFVHRKAMVVGVATFTISPVADNAPVPWSTRKITIVPLTWFAA